MELFLVHCGFYDPEVGEGLYEGHVNFFVAAADFAGARARAKELPAFQAKRMHVDGIQRVVAVDGFRVALEADAQYKGRTELENNKHRELAPTKPAGA